MNIKPPIIALLLLLPLIGIGHPKISMKTNYGTITIGLSDKTARTTANFLQYAKNGFYNGTIFHRVIPNFMIQGGGFKTGMTKKPATYSPIKNEGIQCLQNQRGTIAMARTSNPNSATSQFFINLNDNDFLNAQPGKAGYCAFGHVIAGMDVVDKIAALKTHTVGQYQNVPVSPVIIEKVTVSQSE